jgi:hypothetical protein
MSTKAKPGRVPQTELDSIRHKDKRANIPTEELRDFVADAPKYSTNCYSYSVDS